MSPTADSPPPPPPPPPRAPRRSVQLGSWLAAGAVLVLGLLVWSHGSKHAAPSRVHEVPVTAGHPVFADFPIRVNAVGTVQSRNAVDLKVRVDGQLQRLLFIEGQDVEAGQVLAQLDKGPLSAQLRQAEAIRSKDRASLENAKLDFDRYTKLAGIGAATTQSVDTARAQVQALTATVAADAEIVRNDRLQLGFATLTAPFAGRVGAREADIGAIVHPSDATGIVTVTQMEPIDVQFAVPQDVLPDVLAAQVEAPLQVAVTAGNGQTLARGALSFVDSQVDRATGQIKLKAAFANSNRRLWPGELVNARLLLRTDRQRIAVPSRAIVNTQAGPQLYAIDAAGHAELRAVHPGADVDGLTEILGGIAAGDLVVFEGQSRLTPGVHVAAKLVGARDEAALPAPPVTLDAAS